MTNIEETSNKSTARKTLQVANDINTVIVIGVAVVGLGKLAFDSAKFGIDKIKAKKATKTEK
jgi:hypothetical protein